MKPLIIAIASLTAAILFLSPGFCVTIKPGTYKLQWTVITEDDEDRIPIWREVPVARIDSLHRPTNAPKLLGVVSSSAYVGKSPNYHIVLDESNGTGSGYDTAYIVRASESNIVDVTNSTKIPLQSVEGSIFARPSADRMVGLSLGKGASRVVKKAPVRLDVCFSEDPDRKVIAAVEVRLFGRWVGNLRTDSGSLKVQLLDTNTNGTYGDKCCSDLQIHHYNDMQGFYPMDGFIFGQEQPPIYLYFMADILQYDGRLYETKVSRTGDTLEIRPYLGPVGRVRLQTRDGHGKPADSETDFFYNQRGAFLVDSHKFTTVPAGKYRMHELVVSLKTNREYPDIRFTMSPNRTIKVPERGSTLVTAGGEMKIEINPGANAIYLAEDRQIPLRLRLTLGRDVVSSVTGPFSMPVGNGVPMTVSVTDTSGKSILTETADYVSDGLFLRKLFAPTSLKPGVYTLTVTLDPRPYQDVTSATKKLIAR